MGFKSGNFAKVKDFGNKTMYAYDTTDTKATVEGSGYFNDVAPYSLNEGDIIICCIDSDGTIDTATYAVSDKTSGVVTIIESGPDEKAHDRSHGIASALDHTSEATEGKVLVADENGLPVEGTNSDAEVFGAVTNSHSHSNMSLLDTYSQTEADLADAVSRTHTQNSDTVLDEGGANEVSAAQAKEAYEASHDHNSDDVHVFGEIADISTGGSSWTVCPVAGEIVGIYSVIDGAITVADAALSFELGGTAITGGGITIGYDGSTAGDVDSATPSGNNIVSAGQAIEMITDGGSTGAVKAKIVFVVEPG